MAKRCRKSAVPLLGGGYPSAQTCAGLPMSLRESGDASWGDGRLTNHKSVRITHFVNEKMCRWPELVVPLELLLHTPHLPLFMVVSQQDMTHWQLQLLLQSAIAIHPVLLEHYYHMDRVPIGLDSEHGRSSDSSIVSFVV